MFKVACFVRVSDSERRDNLLRWCVNLGYTYIFPPREEKYSQGVVCDTACVGVAHDAETFTLLHCVDCGENVEMFKGLVALNDANDYMQWWANESTGRWSLCESYRHYEDAIISEWEGCGRHKATSTEILEHF